MSGGDVGNVTNMSRMFDEAYSFNVDIGEWNVSNVTDMSAMFRSAINFNANISDWDISNVNDMSAMFQNAIVFNSNLSSWNVENVSNMSAIFYRAFAFNADIGYWDVENVTNMRFMFNQAEAFNADISVWDVANVSDMSGMFHDAYAFNANLSSWDVSNVNDMFGMWGMFDNSGLSTDNYDAILIEWSLQEVAPNVFFSATGINYCISEDARQSLIDNYGWTIIDAGLDCSTVEVDDETKLNVSVYPNPTSNILNIKAGNTKLEAVVFDLLGKEVGTHYIIDKIDISHLEPGVYFIKLSEGKKVTSHKII